jgi:hypothetical protein
MPRPASDVHAQLVFWVHGRRPLRRTASPTAAKCFNTTASARKRMAKFSSSTGPTGAVHIPHGLGRHERPVSRFFAAYHSTLWMSENIRESHNVTGSRSFSRVIGADPQPDEDHGDGEEPHAARDIVAVCAYRKHYGRRILDRWLFREHAQQAWRRSDDRALR